MIDKIVILNCWKREKEGKVLQKIAQSTTKIPVEISYDDGSGSEDVLERMWANYVNALKLSKKKYRLVIHDDMLFGRGVFDKIEHILSFMPEDSFISFFNPNNKQYREAYKKGHRILKTKSNFWMPVFCFPTSLIDKFIEFGSQPKFYGKSDDFRITAFCNKFNINIYAIVPSYFQHLGPYRSAIGNPGKVGKNIRYSLLYKPEMKANVDWKKEIKNAYCTEKNWGVNWNEY